jgi:serine/threonine protein kinase
MFIPNYIKEKYEFIDINPLGAGGFGAVFLIRDKRVFNEGVLKIISKQNTEKKYFDKEKNFLLKVKGTNIVKLIDYYEDDKSDYYYFVFEKMEGDLQQLLDTKYKNGMPLEMIKKIFSQLNSALKLMKNFEISHRDLKPANILYSYIDSNKNDFIIKLADFGLATNLKNTNIATYAGTPFYMAPEIEKEKYSDKCDLYSLGIILYQLKTGNFIFGNTYEEFYTNRKNNNLKKTGDKLLDDLIKNIVAYDPKDRINWDEYFNHPFFKCKNI